MCFRECLLVKPSQQGCAPPELRPPPRSSSVRLLRLVADAAGIRLAYQTTNLALLTAPPTPPSS